MYDIIIIGAGPAGLTAAIYAMRADKSILLLEKENFGGQITFSPKVENYPGFTSVSGSELAEQLLAFARERCGWRAMLSTYALTWSESLKDTRFLGYPLHLTPREHAILGFLFYSAPKILPSHLLLSVCFPQGHEKAENLSVHISAINRKAIALTGLPLVENCYGEGYRLHTRVFSREPLEKF